MAQAMAQGYSRHGKERNGAWIGECVISKCSAPRTVSVGGRVGVMGPKGREWQRNRMGNKDGASDSGQREV